MIKTEREHCCDDLAVTTVETKIDYIKALVSCQEFASETPAYVMAINGGKSQLVYRVQRLISSRNQSLNKLEKVIIGLVLISAVAITTAFSGKETKPAAVVTNEKEPVQDNSDAFYNQVIKEGLAKAGAELYCTLDEDAFVINGKKQPADIHAKYARLYLKKGQKVRYRFEKDYQNKTSNHVASVKQITRADKEAAEAETASNSVAAASAQSVAIARAAQTAANAEAAQSAATAVAARAAVKAQAAQSAAIARATQPVAVASQKVAAENAKGKNDLTKDLIEDGLIKDKTNLSYQLNADELVVDGEKQSDALHNKYMRRYLKHAKQKISVSVSTN